MVFLLPKKRAKRPKGGLQGVAQVFRPNGPDASPRPLGASHPNPAAEKNKTIAATDRRFGFWGNERAAMVATIWWEISPLWLTAFKAGPYSLWVYVAYLTFYLFGNLHIFRQLTTQRSLHPAAFAIGSIPVRSGPDP